jgi:hypothetical protein
MTTALDSLPDITRSDVDIAVVKRWNASFTTVEQRASADALTQASARTPPGLLTISGFLSTSRSTDVRLLPGIPANHGPPRAEAPRMMMSYEQWASEDAYRSSLAAQHKPGRQPAAEPYRLYRSQVNADSQDTMPGSHCVVIVTIGFDGSDEQRLRRWIDAVVDALEAEPNAIPGMISGHFHASLAGNRVLNYAEWTSEQAYDDALAHGPAGVGQTDLPHWRTVREFAGVTTNTVTRYALDRAIPFLPPAADNS